MMNKWTLTTRDVLALAGLQKKSSFLDKTLPIAAGVGAGLVAGIGVTVALLTPSRREKLTQRVQDLWSKKEKVDLFAAKKEHVVHSDAPGTDTNRKLHGKDATVRA